MGKSVLLPVAVLFLVPLSAFTYAQTKKPVKTGSKTTAAPKQNLSDDFAKASLRALRAIEGELGEPSFENGSMSVPRNTYERISDADVEARTDEEKSIVKTLNNFFVNRVMNNLRRRVIGLSVPVYNAESAHKRDNLMATDPEVLEMNSREAACSRAVDDILRKRYFAGKITACDGVGDVPRTERKN